MNRFASVLSAIASLLFVTACATPLRPCLPECGPPDAWVDPGDAGVDANDLDADLDTGVDANSDAGSDANADAGPPSAPTLDPDVLPDHVCGLGGWCWLSPEAPVEASWADVASVGTEAWVVTEDAVDGATPGGALLHYDGAHWRGLVGRGARRVDGSGPSDVWFVSGTSEVTHWDGARFASGGLTEADRVTDIASTAANDVWVVGDAGTIVHFDGTAWLDLDVIGIDFTSDLRSVHAAAAGDVWIAGALGRVRHWNGTAWTVHDAPPDLDIDVIWALPGSTTVWIGGSFGARYWDPTTMTWLTPTGSVAANIVDIAGTTPSAVYLVSTGVNDFRASGTVLSLLTDGAPECELRSVAPFGTGYLRVGSRAMAGTLACPIDVRPLTPSNALGTNPVPAPLGRVRSIEAFTPEAILVYSESGAWRGDPTGHTYTAAPTLVPMGLAAGTIEIEAAGGPDDLWIDTHDGSVLHWDGTAWAPIEVLAGATDVIVATDGAATWAAADGSVFEWMGGTFMPRGPAFATDVVALSVADAAVWATHSGGTTLTHFVDGAWVDEAVGAWPVDCAPLVAQDADTVECLGEGGLMRFDVGGTPTLITLAGDAPPFAAGDLRALSGEHGWIFATTTAGEADEHLLWPLGAGADTWHARSSGIPGGGRVRMLEDGTTWRVIGDALLEWRDR